MIFGMTGKAHTFKAISISKVVQYICFHWMLWSTEEDIYGIYWQACNHEIIFKYKVLIFTTDWYRVSRFSQVLKHLCVYTAYN